MYTIIYIYDIYNVSANVYAYYITCTVYELLTKTLEVVCILLCTHVLTLVMSLMHNLRMKLFRHESHTSESSPSNMNSGVEQATAPRRRASKLTLKCMDAQQPKLECDRKMCENVYIPSQTSKCNTTTNVHVANGVRKNTHGVIKRNVVWLNSDIMMYDTINIYIYNMPAYIIYHMPAYVIHDRYITYTIYAIYQPCDSEVYISIYVIDHTLHTCTLHICIIYDHASCTHIM